MVIALGCRWEAPVMITEKRKILFSLHLQGEWFRLELVVHLALQCSGPLSEAGHV